MSDKTKHPQHYKLPDMPYEAIDVIRAVLGEEGFRKFCRGNSLKYLIRADKKGGIYDLSKARDYIDYEMMGMQEPEEPPKTDDDLRAVLDECKPAQPEKRWIPCSEELPKENGHYLVTFHQTATEEDLGFDMDDTDVRKMRYDTKHGWRTPRHIPSWINDAVVSTVLAWMPLPEPYKEEQK